MNGACHEWRRSSAHVPCCDEQCDDLEKQLLDCCVRVLWVCVRVWVRLGPLLTLAWTAHTHTDILESGMLLWYEHARSHPQLRLPADLNAIIKRLEPAQEVHIITTSQPATACCPSPNTHTTITDTHTTTGLSVCACHSTPAEAHE